jgi:thiol-disulfide isomerase/thioredoxin
MTSRSLPTLLLFLVLTFTLGAPSLLRAEITEEMAKKLFAPETPLEEFVKIADEAAKQGAPAQIVAEAKLIWGLKNRNTAYLSSIVPELEAVAKNFKKEESAGLGSEQDFKALIHYIRALDAARAGDSAKVKEHITEAFWLSPEQATLFAETITFFRRKAKMDKITVGMKAPITTSRAEDTTLGDVLGKNKAVLLDFWASWCGPCMTLMPEVRAKAEYLRKHGVVVAGMNTEGDEGIAEKVRTEREMKDVAWLVEPKAKPFSNVL